jgi:hypothetical protein
VEARLTLRALILIATICPVTRGASLPPRRTLAQKCIGGARSSKKRTKHCENQEADNTAMRGNDNSFARGGIGNATRNTRARGRDTAQPLLALKLHAW